MFKRVSLISAFALLAACGTPQEECINRETRDLRMLDRLIAETEGNLQRGFAYENVEIFHSVWVQCGGYSDLGEVDARGGRGRGHSAPQLCLDDREYTTTRTKAINKPAEQAKLKELVAQRKKAATAADRLIAACRKTYPE
jgi:hypothetical protein